MGIASWDLPALVDGAKFGAGIFFKLNTGNSMVYTFEQVHNYYERLVLEDVARRAHDYPEMTAEMLADVACVALNRLPARYVRHDVDMMFYLTEQERHAIELSLSDALEFAFALVQQRTSKSSA